MTLHIKCNTRKKSNVLIKVKCKQHRIKYWKSIFYREDICQLIQCLSTSIIKEYQKQNNMNFFFEMYVRRKKQILKDNISW